MYAWRSSGVPIAARASGFVATYQPVTTDSARNAAITPTVHHRIRYSAAGSRTTKNRAISDHRASCDPATRARARPSSWDSRVTTSGSGAVERTSDRSVAVARYSRTSSSASAPVSRRVRASLSSRSHAGVRVTTSASRSMRTACQDLAVDTLPAVRCRERR